MIKTIWLLMQITYQIGMMDKGLETLFNDNIL
jgi:hypothetical protein